MGYFRAAGTGLARGALGLPAALSDFGNFALGQYGNAPLTKNTPLGFAARGMQAVGKAVPRYFGEDSTTGLMDKYLPAEKADGPRAVQNISEGIGGAVLPGGVMSLGQRLLLGAASGTGAAAGEAALGPLGGLVGAVLGGGGASLGMTWKDNSRRILKEGMENTTPKDFAAARRAERTLEGEGISHLKSQLLPNSTLPEIVQQASENPSVLPKLRSALANSGEEAQGALSRWRYSELPLGIDSSRQRLGGVGKKAASSLKGLQNEANQAFEKSLGKGASEQIVPEEDLIPLIDRLYSIADDPRYLGRLDENTKMIDRMVGKISDLNSSLGVRQGDLEGLARGLQKQAAKEGLDGQTARMLKEAIQEFTPGYAPARAAKTAFMRENVDPAKAGLIGDAARTKAPLSLTSKFFPRDSTQVTELTDFGRRVGPDALGEVLDEHIGKVANSAFRKPLTGPEQINDFTSKLMGTQAQRKNIYAALDVIAEGNGADPRKVRVGFAKLLRGLETFQNAKIGDRIDRVALEQKAGQNVAGTTIALQSRLARLRQLTVTKQTYEKIGKIVTSKDGLSQLEVIAESKDPKILQMYTRSLASEAGTQIEAGAGNEGEQ